jgi:DNA-binding XRE family transcriptional regulator
MNLGKTIKSIRKNIIKENQRDFAASIGITQTYISQIEGGGKQASQTLVEVLSRRVGIPVLVIYWLAMDDNDIPSHKLPLYQLLKPSVDQMITMVFDINPNTLTK